MIGIGGKTKDEALGQLTDMNIDITPIQQGEYLQRIKQAQRIMSDHNIDAMYLNAGTNLYYFTGTKWFGSERLVGAILPQQGSPIYLTPEFEVDSLKQYMQVEGEIASWQEHESPYQLVVDVLKSINIASGILAIDESTPFFIANGIALCSDTLTLIDAKPITAGCRMRKSKTELALLQRTKDMTLAVHKAAASILYEGISTEEVTQFIDRAHKKVGASAGSYFCIVLFGRDSSFPHGVKQPKTLDKNDIVLIDTGCQLAGYKSDITRTYVFGEANSHQRNMWEIEKNAQLAAFNAAQIGKPCGNVDFAARDYLAKQGLGPNYQTPGCPHRTGHGIGLDIHEWPYLVKGDLTPLAEGMCFSNEPMLVLPEEFGIRLEDHFYMTESGPKWFTEPSYAIDDPFGLNKAG